MIIPAKSQAFISCKPKCKIAVRGSHLAMPTAVFAMQQVQSQQQDSSSESSDSPDTDSDSSSNEYDRGHKCHKNHAKRHYVKCGRASNSRSESPRRRRSREHFSKSQKNGRAQSDSEDDDFGELRSILQSSAPKQMLKVTLNSRKDLRIRYASSKPFSKLETRSMSQ